MTQLGLMVLDSVLNCEMETHTNYTSQCYIVQHLHCQSLQFLLQLGTATAIFQIEMNPTVKYLTILPFLLEILSTVHCKSDSKQIIACIGMDSLTLLTSSGLMVCVFIFIYWS